MQKKKNSVVDAKDPKGYFIVRPHYTREENDGFKLYLEYRVDGEKVTKYIPRKLWLNYGFQAGISVEKAKELASQLNKERHDLRKEINSAKRFEELTRDERFFPQEMAQVFWNEYIGDNRGSDDHKKKLHSQFLTIQNIVKELKVYPDKYKSVERKFITLFIKNQYSVNYSKVLIKMVNLWGDWYSKQFQKRYDPIRLTSNFDKAAIAKSQSKKTGTDSTRGVRMESKPLTPELLKKNKDKFTEEENNWMYISIWLGLRPAEIDSLKDPATWQLEEVESVPVLCVYQSKLITLPEEKRWKKIPCFTEQQKAVLSIIESGNFKKPIYQKMRQIYKGVITHYGGRKGFISLMRDLGQDYVDISAWLGHQSTETTYRHYTDKQEVRWTRTPSKAS